MQQLDLFSAISFLQEGAVLLKDDGSVLFANDSAERLYKQEKGGLVGKTFQEILALCDDEGEDGARKKSFYETCVNTWNDGGAVISETLCSKAVSGLCSPLKISCIPMTGEGGPGKILLFSRADTDEDLKRYRERTKETLRKILPVLRNIATGDFSDRIEIPDQDEENEEFVELLAGIQLMIDDIVELSARKEAEQQGKIQSIKESENQFAQKAEEVSQELQHAKQHIETIIENLTSGLIEYDGEFFVRRVNHSAEEMLGIKRQEILGAKVSPEQKDLPEKESLVVVSYPVLAKEGKRIHRKMFGENVSVHEVTINYPERRQLEVVTIPLIRAGTSEYEGFIKVIRDITKEKEISQSKSDFINIAAHQLRTPLSAIKWVLRMILDGDVGSLAPSQRKLLDKGYETNEKMITMVNDLLNVARIEDDRFGYVFKEGSVVNAVVDVVDELRIMAEKGGLDLIFDKPNDIEPFVFDFAKIQLAFHNLIGNAIKYTSAGGTVHVSLRKEGENVIATVQDTGVGIPKEQIGKMFTKFFRAENAVRLQVGGSGLGLFIVKDIMTRHGGTITVESMEGKGTTFTMSIPIRHDTPSPVLE